MPRRPVSEPAFAPGESPEESPPILAEEANPAPALLEPGCSHHWSVVAREDGIAAYQCSKCGMLGAGLPKDFPSPLRGGGF